MVFDRPGQKDGLTPNDVKALEKLALSVAHENLIFIEVGSWKGHSTSILASIAKQFNGLVYCVDHWQGSVGVFQHKLETDCFTTFKNNLKELDLYQYVRPLVMDSESASRIFKDNVADLLFLDADHRYTPFKTDFKNWEPKVRKGGIFCGHDCENHYYNLSSAQRDLINMNLEKDFCDELRCHAGVIKALQNERICLNSGTSIWQRTL